MCTTDTDIVCAADDLNLIGAYNRLFFLPDIHTDQMLPHVLLSPILYQLLNGKIQLRYTHPDAPVSQSEAHRSLHSTVQLLLPVVLYR